MSELLFVLVVAGFALGVLGHLSGSRLLVAIGVGLVALGALVVPLVVNLTEGSPPSLERAR